MALRSLICRKTLGLASSSGFKLQFRGLQTFSLPDLPYDYGALEPAISGEIMQIHHQKHHQTYITNYNKALEQLHHAIEKGDSSSVVKLQSAIKFNGGGHINHSIFWKSLSPVCEGGGESPHGSLGWAIDEHYGSLDALIQKMSTEGAALQGSGWVWLGLDKESKKLVVETTVNQDPLVTKGPLVPLLGIDVWEHAYYLQYKNVRPDYLKNIWKSSVESSSFLRRQRAFVQFYSHCLRYIAPLGMDFGEDESESDDSAGSVEESCSESEVEDDNDAVNEEEWTSSAEAKSDCSGDDAVDLEANAEAALKKLLPCSLEEFEKVCSLKYQLSDRRYYTAYRPVQIGGVVWSDLGMHFLRDASLISTLRSGIGDNTVTWKAAPVV
ncbi:hypothetical protein OIU77_006242 [Salix suchowensis]|uniref:superoxide dismutase n=1 Tax=Salix suchowensis TaxID=1278906 RepID=A0ABQ9AK96_9ROSI|nr:hypothetical protein OIU77_006242 [Salix suchowensis]